MKHDNYFYSISGWFLGIFNGNNYQIMNLKFAGNHNDPKFMALFEYVGDHNGEIGIVKNLIISGNISSSHWAASIAYGNYGIINNCINLANIHGALMGFDNGGIVSNNMEKGIISNCINYGQIGILKEVDNFSGTGGIAGSNAGIIENCINYGTLLGGRCTGGIAGHTSSNSIKNCINYGTIIGVNIDKNSGIVSVFTSLNGKPYPEKPTDNENYGSVIVIEK